MACKIEWKISDNSVDYEDALSVMERRVADIHAGRQSDMVWLLEHPPLYTGGTSAKSDDLLSSEFPVYQTGRGGQYTYHGPGQRVAYVMLDLKQRQKSPDIKHYIWQLEEWIIQSLREFDIEAERREGRIGLWVVTKGGEKKIAAIGVRIRHWITFHGVAINVNPDLSHFGGIVPCGIANHGVTSMADLGKHITMAQLDQALQETFANIFDKNTAQQN